MKTIAIVLGTLIALCSPASAQVSFVTGMIVGSMLSSDSSPNRHGSISTVFEAEGLAQIKIDPMKLAICYQSATRKPKVSDAVSDCVKEPSAWIILHIGTTPEGYVRLVFLAK